MFGKKDAAPLLSDVERQSALWKKLKAHLDAKLAQFRETNDKRTLTEIDTAYLRGRIKELKELAALDEKPSAPSQEKDPFD